MRPSWVLTILLLLCFTFAGCAAGKPLGNQFITEKHNIVHERGSNSVKVDGQDQSLQEGQDAPGLKKGRKDINDMLDTIETKAGGDVATFFNETCWYVWNGYEWKKKCIL